MTRYTVEYRITDLASLSQRGMGRSTPSFIRDECSVPDLQDGFDLTNRASVQEYVDELKANVFDCWHCQDCDFQLEATQEDGTTSTFHFLQYSGTRQLVEDIERVRILFGNQKLSIYGISYGVKVNSVPMFSECLFILLTR